MASHTSCHGREGTHSFLASTFENWQSEFLQLFTFVVLATYLIHRRLATEPRHRGQMAADIEAIKQKLGA